MKTILGIDPGQSGALVLIDETGQIKTVCSMPETPMDIFETIGSMNPDICYLEDVGQGMPGQSSKATAKFARHNGHLEMALLALRISTIKILPSKWQKALGLLTKKGESKTSHKNRIKAWSQRTFPQIKVTLKNADALAIAYFGAQQNNRTQSPD